MAFDPDAYLRNVAGFDPDAWLARQPRQEPGHTRADAAAVDPTADRRIAIVGMAGRFPGAANIDQYWKNLLAGRESITFFPPDQVETASWLRIDSTDARHVGAAGILADADRFDSALFGYSAAEANYMDPQQRVMLECAWTALEHAGYNPRRTGLRTGIFAGTVYSTYLWSMMSEGCLRGPAERMLATVGNLEDNLTTRAAYKLNLRGPAVTVQTACSSSLVAVHLAAQSLLSGQCDMALAGGVAIVFPQKTGYIHNPDLIESADGHCRAFSEGSTGTVFSNGAGIVVLKRLNRALADGDTVHAVILGSAINNDGIDKIGYTAPSVSGQVEVIREALRTAAVPADSIRFVEAHGTGTPLGDPIEIAALNLAFQGDNGALPRASCAIGSVKTNFGHLNTAAGVAGLIKAALALKHRELPASLHFEKPNPEVDFDGGPFFVNTGRLPLTPGDVPLRGSISSFGIGGTNAHVVLEEPPPPRRPVAASISIAHPPAAAEAWTLVTVSARNIDALTRLLGELDVWLRETEPRPDLTDLAFTLNVGRNHWPERAAFVVRDLDELIRRVGSVLENRAAPGCWTSAGIPGTANTSPVDAEPDSIETDPARSRLADLARRYVAGGDVDWKSILNGTSPRRVPLPTYPFERRRHWYPSPARDSACPPAKNASVHRRIAASDVALRDHRILGRPTVSAAAIMKLAMESSPVSRSADEAEIIGAFPVLHDLQWRLPVIAPDGEDVDLHLEWDRRNADGGEVWSCSVRREPDSNAPVFASMQLAPADSSATPPRPAPLDLGSSRARLERVIDARTFYDEASMHGADYGPVYRQLDRIRHDSTEAVASVVTRPDRDDWDPGLIDAGLQAAAVLAFAELDPDPTGVHVPAAAKTFQCFGSPRTVTGIHVELIRNNDPDGPRASVRWINDAGEVLAWLDQLRFAPANAARSRSQSTAVSALPNDAPRDSAPSESTPGVEGIPPSRIEPTLIRLFSEVLNVEERDIDPGQSFADFGVDSVLAVSLVQSVNETFQLSLRSTDLFDHSTIRRLAGWVRENLPTTLESEPESEPEPEPHPELKTDRQKMSEGDLRADSIPIPAVEHRSQTVSAPRPAPSTEPIAVIGMSGRFPGAPDLETFWRNLVDGRSSVVEVPRERWARDRFYDPDDGREDRSPFLRAGMLEGVDRFDPLAFQMSPREAELMDPQQRLFLQICWHALEDAGHGQERLADTRCGVFVGVGPGDYGQALMDAGVPPSGYVFTGNATSVLAARIAYLLDLRGPTIAVDTACSSSLVSVHLACQSLLTGDADLAIAGGVHLMTTPRIHLLSAKAGMLAPDGRCKTFDDRADGMVLGEGAGAVVLKRLDRALADRDRIHAVIPASGVNQDGRTNGITAPSSRSQTDLELAVFHRAAVDPSTITLVEAHGTGTQLGDPIELHALSDAFRRFTNQTGFCALGSVKTNIGHLMTAAGIASLIKVLLCLRHRSIPPSLNFENPNRHFEFERSPFFVNRSARDWVPADGQPLRAAVSSFGFSGANAHLIVEQPPEPKPEPARIQDHPDRFRPIGPCPCPVSAASMDSLEMVLKRLLDRLGDGSSVDLPALSRQLCVGRTHLDCRILFIAESIADLQRQLAAHIDDGTQKARRDGNGDAGAEPNTNSDSDSDAIVEFIRNAWKEGRNVPANRWNVLAEKYQAGAVVPWMRLFSESTIDHVDLPRYPFAEKHCWHPALNGAERSDSGRSTSFTALETHQTTRPATSDQAPPVACPNRFRAAGSILDDHVARDVPYLPGAACLAIASIPEPGGAGGFPVRFDDVIWLRPAMARPPGHLDIELCRSGQDGRAHIDVRADADAPPFASLDMELPNAGEATTERRIDPDAIRRRCAEAITGDDLYRWFEERGLRYGPAFRGLRHVLRGQDESIAEMVMSAGRDNPFPGALIDPFALDCAFQTTAAAAAGDLDGNETVGLPFALARAEFFGPMPSRAWVHARRRGSAAFDLTVADVSGRVIAELSDLAFRPPRFGAEHPEHGEYGDRVPSPASASNPVDAPMLLEPVWQVQPEPKPDSDSVASDPDRTGTGPLVIVGGSGAGALMEAFRSLHAGSRVLTVFPGNAWDQISRDCLSIDRRAAADWERLADRIEPGSRIVYLGCLDATMDRARRDGLDAALEPGVLSLFRLIRALRPDQRPGLAAGLFVVTADHALIPGEGTEPAENDPFAGPAIGLARVAAREYPALNIHCIDLARPEITGETAPARLAARRILQEPRCASDGVVAWRAGKRYLSTVQVRGDMPERRTDPPLRQRGVYLILGGAGGIGAAIALRLAERVSARVILVGRSSPDDRIGRICDAIHRTGGEALYLCADATDRESLESAVDRGRARFGPIHGIIHSAIVLKDAALANMSEPDFRAAFDPKVAGAWNLESVTRRDPLDFIVYFSSAASLFGNPGQANYVAGCAFKDAFAQYLAATGSARVRVVNWGFWIETGAVASEAYRERFERQGILPLTTAEGLTAFEHILASEPVQTGVVRFSESACRQLGILDAPQRVAPAGSPGRRAGSDAGTAAAHPSEAIPHGLEEAIETIERHAAARAAALVGSLVPGVETGNRNGTGNETDPPPTRFTEASLRDYPGIQPAYHRFISAVLRILVDTGWVSRDEDQFRWLKAPPNLDAMERESEILRDRFPGLAAYLDLLDTCGRACLDVLTGVRDAVSVLFPDGSFDLVENIYRGNELADYYNGLLARSAAETAVRLGTARPDRPVRILEIGAGTGGATGLILAALKDAGVSFRYCFTDVSAGFLAAAGDRFGQEPGRTFRELDIEADPVDQGFEPGCADLVLASNVLHATASLSDTLRNARRLIASDGVLLINELTRAFNAVTLTFGLTDGWWRFHDADRSRGGQPLIAFDQWRDLLRRSGFEDVAGQGIESLGRNVISARRTASAESSTPTHEAGLAHHAESVGHTTRMPVHASIATDPPALKFDGDDHDHDHAAIVRSSARFLWGRIAEVLKMDDDSLNDDASARSFEKIGVDSLVTLDLIRRLEKDFGKLPKTLFFEHNNLKRLTDYFLRQHRDRLLELAGARGIEPSGGGDSSRAGSDDGPARSDTVRHGAPSVSTSSAPASNRIEGGDDIAIVGASGRFPGAENLARFWENLRSGKPCIRKLPEGRWKTPPTLPESERPYTDHGGFLDGIDRFDPLFFRISPREAELMDPQERLFLEVAWESVEDAGYTRAALSAGRSGNGAIRTGVFAGVMYGSYQLHGAEAWARGRFVNASSGYWCVANRVSYTFDLQGPSLAVDTACSSSLTAIHLACESLRRGDCDMAIAGGANLILHPTRFHQLCQVQMLARDGKCRSFGANASGFVVGEGVGALVLKPLRRAIEDGDSVHAVIKGSAINAGGRTNGFTVPNPNAQADVIARAMKLANVDPRDISYVEAHGTGTALGDPIEIAGLETAFRRATADRQFCAIGSVKSSVGHLEAAAGVASVIKVMLMMRHGEWVPTLNSEPPNPDIDFDRSPFFLQRELAPWNPMPSDTPSRARKPRLAGISSFGAGGSNAHLILEEFRESRPRPSFRSGPPIIVLSARDAGTLRDMAKRLSGHLKRTIPSESETAPSWFHDVAYTLQTGRECMDHRLAVVTEDPRVVVAELDAFAEGGPGRGRLVSGVRDPRAHSEFDAASARGMEDIRAWMAARTWDALALSWVSGGDVPWTEIWPEGAGRIVPLPTYPFRRERYWLPETDDTPPVDPGIRTIDRPHPLIAENVSAIDRCQFRCRFDEDHPLLADHLVGGTPVLPGAALVEIARGAAELWLRKPVRRLARILWLQPLRPIDGVLEFFVTFSQSNGALRFAISTDSTGGAAPNVRGAIPLKALPPEPPAASDIEQRTRNAPDTGWSADALYGRFRDNGLQYGPTFRTLAAVWPVDGGSAMARFRDNPTRNGICPDAGLHPGLIDGALQAAAGLAFDTGSAADSMLLPFSIGSVTAWRDLGGAAFALARPGSTNGAPARSGPATVACDITLFDARGNALVSLDHCVFRSAPIGAEPTAAPVGDRPLKSERRSTHAAPITLSSILEQLETGDLSVADAERMAAAAGLVRIENGLRPAMAHARSVPEE